jgi:hypothetical protein
MTGPLLPGESADLIRSLPTHRPTLAILPTESQAIADLARLAYLQGVADAESPDCDLDPFF